MFFDRGRHFKRKEKKGDDVGPQNYLPPKGEHTETREVSTGVNNRTRRNFTAGRRLARFARRGSERDRRWVGRVPARALRVRNWTGQMGCV